MALIKILQAGQSVEHELVRDETLIGRSEDCTILVPQTMTMVSRRHARILKQGPQFLLEDLNSGNGTVLNGTKITGPSVLKNEDRIKIGPMLMVFSDVPRRGGADRETPTVTDVRVNVQFTDEADDQSEITSTIDVGTNRFGTLEVQPAVKLKALIQLSQVLAGTVELEKLLPRILEVLFSVFPGADRGCIMLKDVATGQMTPRAMKHRREDEDETVKLSRTIIRKVLEAKAGILSADAVSDSAFAASESIASFTIRSMMCVPLLGLDGEPLGLIHIDTQNASRKFSKDDLDLLTAVAGQAAIAYETARLITSYLEKQKYDNEMKIAANVQRALLPERLPTAPGYEFYASYESAQAVGGDYYDCLTLPGNRICLAFGDVAGKGVPASLVMSRLSSVVQNTLEFVQDVGQAAERINSHMCANAVEGRFVTFVLAIVDLNSHQLSLIIAGHMSPMIRRPDGTIEEFPEDIVGLPLGVADGMSFDVVTRSIAPGETIVIYTDGVSEAMNPGNDLYGEDRLRALIQSHAPAPEALGRAILADVRQHAAGREQNDDITLMVFGRHA